MPTQKLSFITPHNLEAVKAIVEQKASDRIVVERQLRNVDGMPPDIDEESLWHEHIMCLLTSKQPSSWNDPVPRFLRETPFPLSLEKCRQADDVFAFVRSTLHASPGIRFRDQRIPAAVSENFKALEAGGWDKLLSWAEVLKRRRRRKHTWMNYEADRDLEEEAADYIDKHYKGFGPKQARNFWQALGLTRYVCVIDSRIKSWCVNNLDGPWSQFELGGKKDYKQMARFLQEICVQAKILPCIFDAAVFANAETGEGEPLAASWCRGD